MRGDRGIYAGVTDDAPPAPVVPLQDLQAFQNLPHVMPRLPWIAPDHLSQRLVDRFESTFIVPFDIGGDGHFRSLLKGRSNRSRSLKSDLYPSKPRPCGPAPTSFQTVSPQLFPSESLGKHLQ